LEELRTFLAEYHELPDGWAPNPFDNNGTPALHTESEAFWVPVPQLAVEVRDPFGLIGPEEVLATARGVTTSPAGVVQHSQSNSRRAPPSSASTDRLEVGVTASPATTEARATDAG